MKAHWTSVSLSTLLAVGAGLALNTKAPVSGAPTAQAQGGEELANTSGCVECHAVNKKVIGPPFRDVAARYRQEAGARDALIRKVRKGGKGNWTEVTGGVPMPPFSPRLSDAEIARLVDWVLSL